MAEDWFHQFEGAGLDGVVAKPLAATYQEKARTMLKIKHERTADVVVAGYREHKTSTPERPLLGSLLLGLYVDGKLQHIGVSASFTEKRRAELIEEMQQLVVPIEEHPWGEWQEWAIANPDRVPGTQSRWSAGKDLSFTPLRPERVLEVAYDHMEGRRFRHTAQFRRWRPDRDPESCGYEQLEEPVSYDLARILDWTRVREAMAMAEDYDVVLLVEQALTNADAAQVRSLHEGLDEPVTYHVLLPMEDAAARIEASMGSLAAGEVMASPAMAMREVDIEAVRKDCRDRSDRDLAATLAALKAAGALAATGEVVTKPPIDALAEKVAAVDGREAIILTRPHVVSEFFHVDWTSRARRKIGVPVLHLLEHENFDEQAGGGEGVTGI